MRGMLYLIDRPECEWPEFVKINSFVTRQHKNGWTKPKRNNNRRSSSDKTGQATRSRMRRDLLTEYGNLCHICLANGITDQRAVIDITLVWPSEMCFTRDHVIPRSQGGPDTLENMRPAHHKCNRDRGDGPIVVAGMLGESEVAA